MLTLLQYFASSHADLNPVDMQILTGCGPVSAFLSSSQVIRLLLFVPFEQQGPCSTLRGGARAGSAATMRGQDEFEYRGPLVTPPLPPPRLRRLGSVAEVPELECAGASPGELAGPHSQTF